MITKSEECRGCFLDRICLIKKSDKGNQKKRKEMITKCPCRNCLVKVTCQTTACDLYEKWINEDKEYRSWASCEYKR